MQTCFIISLIIAVVGLLGAVANFHFSVKREFQENLHISKKPMGIHLLCGAFWTLGGLGSVVFGIIWAIQHFTA